MDLSNITLKNIRNFFEGNITFYQDKILGVPKHIKEQYYYRLFKCKDDCLLSGTCMKCTCPVIKKAYIKQSCNPDRFPDLMSGSDWEKYKVDNNIDDAIFTKVKKLLKEYDKPE